MSYCDVERIAKDASKNGLVLVCSRFFAETGMDVGLINGEWLKIHRHPDACPSPPSVLEGKRGDIYGDDFMKGRLNGLILNDNGEDVLYVFHEPDNANEGRFKGIFNEFWVKRRPIFFHLLEIAMQPLVEGDKVDEVFRAARVEDNEWMKEKIAMFL